MNTSARDQAMVQWLSAYKNEHHALLEADPAFQHWLETEYVPLAGAWQY